MKEVNIHTSTKEEAGGLQYSPRKEMLDAQALELAGLSKKAIDGRIVSTCNLKLRYISSSQPSILKKFHVV